MVMLWCVSEIGYFGTHRPLARSTITNAKRSFRPSIFGKVGRLASEKVTLELVKSKCLSILLARIGVLYSWLT